jgi:ADP-ribose pyrophosphatase YjhB (NUDIX family)
MEAMPMAGRRSRTLDFPRPLTTVDVVILTIRDGTLQVLLVKRPDTAGEPFPGEWALPGGFVDVKVDETLEDCARRKLAEKTGVRSPYLEQVGSWGNATRDPRGWSATHLYLAMLPGDALRLETGGNAADVAWMAIHGDHPGDRQRVRLAFDHDQLFKAALARLRGKSEYTSMPLNLLPKEFTLSELQRVFEIVLDRPLEKKAFRTRILSSGLLEATDEMKETSRRPAQIYRAKKRGELVFFPRALEAGR